MHFIEAQEQNGSIGSHFRRSAALYAPLQVVLFEDEQRRAVFEYDKSSSFFASTAMSA
jgi:hypothetical protein